ncbi:MAG: glucose-6-phosphate isomerase [Gammaproteobacteria bacterium]|nr:glucose-6-phosphate isomerase [Gammaproteobacteria bacterium]MBL6999595.1 glucose-6-phosphate isomerase [Gammaproteobacteria bacterium]
MEQALPLEKKTVWKNLQEHKKRLEKINIIELFNNNPSRFKQCSIQQGEFLLDFSKNRIDEKALKELIKLADSCHLPAWMNQMKAGHNINHTERRSVFHIALRAPADQEMITDGRNVVPEIQQELNKMEQFVKKIHEGEWRGYSGRKITQVVNIGIGGSDLGPYLATQSLRPYWLKKVEMHFVSNLDGAQLALTLEGMDPETTLFIIASKSFATLETIYEAQTAREWFLEKAVEHEHIQHHFVALSSNVQKATEFGIAADNIFRMWDWVGGRYSLWSSIGLSIALTIGMDNFRSILAGAHEMDKHFFEADFRHNIPVILALLGIWYRNFFDYNTQAILPYDSLLHLLPSYLQQLDMESNGKHIKRNGASANYATGPIIWGETGSNGQHAFFQFLHQSDTVVPVDFIASINTHYPLRDHQSLLFSNLIAQSEALMKGRNLDEVLESLSPDSPDYDHQQLIARYRTFRGNTPSNTLLINKLTPHNFGALLAMYEHKIFVQGVIWNINSFDQWGVELGKELASHLQRDLIHGLNVEGHDPSTTGLLKHYLKISEPS